MKYIKYILTITLLLSGYMMPSLANIAHKNFSIAFYNTENLFDTLPSQEKGGKEFTPKSKRKWDSQRYYHKLTNIARVIDDMNADMTGICEVENENVVKDLIKTLQTDYCYIHRESSDTRGADIALLYKADRFIVELAELLDMGKTREVLHVRGKIINDKSQKGTLELILCHMPSLLNSSKKRNMAFHNLEALTDSIKTYSNYDIFIVAGDFNATMKSRIFEKTFGKPNENNHSEKDWIMPLATETGSYAYRNTWSLIDNFLIHFTDNKQHFVKAHVFIKGYLLGRNKIPSNEKRIQYGYPLRSYRNMSYEGGFSDHLPIILKYDQ